MADRPRPSQTIRFNAMKTDAAGFENYLKTHDVIFERGLVPGAYRCPAAGNLARLDGFRNGYFSIQGESSMLAALAVVLVMGYVQLTTISGSVSEMKNELTQLNTEHVALLTRYEQTYDLASVKEAAEAAGMSKPSSGQITYIDLGSPDSATVYRSGADGFFSKIADTVDGWLQAAVEYFR